MRKNKSTKGKTKNKKSNVLDECQLKVVAISAKLDSIGYLLMDRSKESTESVYGVGVILTEMASQLETIADKIDPINLL